LIAWIGIDALIATIGTQFAIRGFAYLVGSEQLITNENILWLGQGEVLGIPVPTLLMVATFLLAIWWLNFTVFGRHLRAIGGTHGHAARLAGIPVRRRRMQVYILSGLSSGFAGVVLAGYSSAGLAYAAVGIELTIIAGVVLGGTSFFGGHGTIIGTVIGVLFFAIIANGLVLMNVPTLWQQIVQGTVLIIAVGIDRIRTKGLVVA
jgi:ribose transport system permease protein